MTHFVSLSLGLASIKVKALDQSQSQDLGCQGLIRLYLRSLKAKAKAWP